jgi:ABC-type uncharacterized transport system ATPase subunit
MMHPHCGDAVFRRTESEHARPIRTGCRVSSAANDAQEIRTLCSEISVIAKGRLVYTGPTQALGSDIDTFEEAHCAADARRVGSDSATPDVHVHRVVMDRSLYFDVRKARRLEV